MIYDIGTAWLYAYSPDADHPAHALYTVYVSGPREPKMNGQAVLAQIALSYLTTLSEEGAGALVRSYTPPFGPDAEFTDFSYNSVYAEQCLAVTFELNAYGAESYATASIYVFE